MSLRGVGVRVGVTPILRDVDLDVAAGETLGLFGPNGAGKTTLLRLMATIVIPSAGFGTVLGADLAGGERFDVRSRIGFIGHVPALYPELTLHENLQFAARVVGIAEGRVAEVLEAVGLGRAEGRRVDQCSYGMQRRAEFARELMLEPDLLLLDEPHSALDAGATDLVGHLIAEVKSRGGACVVVTHDRARVEALVDRSVVISSGSLQ